MLDLLLKDIYSTEILTFAFALVMVNHFLPLPVARWESTGFTRQGDLVETGEYEKE